MADPQLPGRPRHPLEHLVVDGVDHDQPGQGRALLSRVPEGRADDDGDGLVEVGVGVDDEGVLAPHLGDDPLDVALAGTVDGRGLDDVEADVLGAGEGDERHVGVLDQVGADVLADAGQEGEHARRQPARGQRLDQPRRHRRRLLGRLEEHRVARDQGGRHHPGGDGEGEVPRGDDDADAPALVAQPVVLPRRRLHRAAPVEA